MAKDLEISFLLDFYGDMLTEKQREVIEFYYNEDLSLSEIADNEGITRQGVRDSIKRGEKQLHDFEDSLGLAKRFKDVKGDIVVIQEMFHDLQTYIQTYIHSDKLLKAVNQIGEKLSSITDKL